MGKKRIDTCRRTPSPDPPADGEAACVAPSRPVVCAEGNGDEEGEESAVARGPPAAINQGDSRSTAREASRLTPASPGGGSSSGPKIHPSPSSARHVSLLHSLEEREINRKGGGGGGRAGCGGEKKNGEGGLKRRQRRRKKPVSTTGPYNTVSLPTAHI